MIAQLPHQAAAGVEGEWPRAALEFHPNLLGQAIPLAVVASPAAGDQVFPGAPAAAGPRHYVVQCQVCCRVSAPAADDGDRKG